MHYLRCVILQAIQVSTEFKQSFEIFKVPILLSTLIELTVAIKPPDNNIKKIIKSAFFFFNLQCVRCLLFRQRIRYIRT